MSDDLLQLEEIAEESPSAILRQRRHGLILDWLEGLPDRKQSAILQYAAAERSPVLSYLYASMLGCPASVDDWEGFVNTSFDKLDTRGLLQSEVVKLHQDIADIRQLVEDEQMRPGDAPTKISYLSRELRAHVETLAKEQVLHDRRSLLLAGVEVTAKLLRKVFGRDGQMWPAIEAALEGVWAEIDERHAFK